ncbi:cytochrome b5-like [Oppia nitens]|uniref:cytochrome b5-like n=1 Tax=Oppia nitens TaxID=1686743 RepID=UPI0023DA566D|nr:cytochrome b5-like [Oppia nitens]
MSEKNLSNDKTMSRDKTNSKNKMSESMSKDKEYTVEEVSKHNTKSSLWIIISDQVFDVTKFLDSHPGGVDTIMNYAGKDATFGFVGNHSDNAEKIKSNYKIGVIKKT